MQREFSSASFFAVNCKDVDMPEVESLKYCSSTFGQPPRLHNHQEKLSVSRIGSCWHVLEHNKSAAYSPTSSNPQTEVHMTSRAGN